MKSRMMISMLVIALVAAVIGGGTMAWFTAKAEVVNEFTAGTVLITADEDADLTDDLGNVNPGECFEKVIVVCNDGTKDIKLRVRFDGEWTFSREFITENWYSLCFSDDPDATPSYAQVTEAISAAAEIDPASFDLGEGWEYDEDDGWWYYDGTLGGAYPEGTDPGCLTVIIDVCFDGDDMTNIFQASTYKLNAFFQAVQASNDAPWPTPPFEEE